VLFLGAVWRGCRAGGEKARVAEARVRTSLDWMRLHAGDPLTLSQIAKQAGLSVPHYCALFKKHTGSSPVRYLRALRLQKACDLLDQSEAPIQTIAEACGFTNPFHFSRSFKAHIGLPPRAYRNSVKG
jgi:transcriptional regulator GlxA family with amidase domain